MATIQVRRGTQAQLDGITPASGELCFTTDTKKVYVGDGSTQGGILVGNLSFDFQPDVLDIQVDASLDPGASPTLGDRYILTDTGNLHANFGSISGVQDDDIVEYNGSAFVVAYDVSVEGEGAVAC